MEFKKLFNLLLFSAALTAGTLLNTACPQPNGGEEPEPQPIENPVEPEKPTTDPDDPTVNPDDPIVEPDDPIVEPDDPIVEPDDPIVEPDNPIVEPDDPTVTYGGEPYDKAIGNGNYILHNFIGENTEFPVETIVDSINHYSNKAETYVKGLADNLDKSLEDRPAARDYLTDYVTAVNNINTFFSTTNPSGRNLDYAIRTIDTAAQTYFTDIIKNLDSLTYRYLFYYCYRTLANESYKEGLGTYRESESAQMDAYNTEKEKIENGYQYYDSENNFAQTTKFMDGLLDMAVNNMNSNNPGVNMKVEDLRQLINLTMTSNSLKAMHELTADNLQHTHYCEMSLGIKTTMIAAITAQQNQGQSMGL